MFSVLIVDDDMAIVDLIERSVRWGKLQIDRVLTAYNVSVAKKIMAETKVDIVISDIEMPRASGVEFLEWLRDRGETCEFLFLTCHQDFEYATKAIHLEVAAYLTKPFNIEEMELHLQKIVNNLLYKRSMEEKSEYGEVLVRNMRHMKLQFWETLVNSDLLDKEAIINEINGRHLDIDKDKGYVLVFTKIAVHEEDYTKYGKSIFDYIVKGFHSELLTGRMENESTVMYNHTNVLSYVTICDEMISDEIVNRCEELISNLKQYFKSTVTCCISDPCRLVDINMEAQRINRLFFFSLNKLGMVFRVKEVQISENHEVQIIDLDQLISFVENKDTFGMLQYLKEVFQKLSIQNNLNVYSLHLMKQEITQVIYGALMKQGVQATLLFHDDDTMKMTNQATDSTVDMIKWVRHLLSLMFEYQRELNESTSIIEKINAFIHIHFSEDIGRNEIAQEFYLTPQYLARLYKKETGINLKNYINDYRINQAKWLLTKSDMSISEIAEKVGFINFSYFSTIFKKSIGLTPKEYRNLNP